MPTISKYCSWYFSKLLYFGRCRVCKGSLAVFVLGLLALSSKARLDYSDQSRPSLSSCGGSLGRYAGHYKLETGSVFSVISKDAKLFVVPVGGRPEEASEVAPNQIEWGDSIFIFASKKPCEPSDVVIIRYEGVSEMATRASADEARLSAEELAIRQANNLPSPKSEVMLRKIVSALQTESLNYTDMCPSLSTRIRVNLRKYTEAVNLGTLSGALFIGVQSNGWDMYRLQFSNGSVEAKISVSTDEKICRLSFKSKR